MSKWQLRFEIQTATEGTRRTDLGVIQEKQQKSSKNVRSRVKSESGRAIWRTLVRTNTQKRDVFRNTLDSSNSGSVDETEEIYEGLKEGRASDSTNVSDSSKDSRKVIVLSKREHPSVWCLHVSPGQNRDRDNYKRRDYRIHPQVGIGLKEKNGYLLGSYCGKRKPVLCHIFHHSTYDGGRENPLVACWVTRIVS